MIKIRFKNMFPTNENEIELVKFIGRFQYLSSKDTKYFFSDTYYPKRITRLIKNGIIRRYKKNLVIAEVGFNYLRSISQEVMPLCYEQRYVTRLKFISHLAAVFFKDKFIDFKPSFEIKEKTAFTESSRKYIGILNIFGTKYLTYHIAETHTSKYITSVIYDIQKETTYKNIIILVNDINRINLRDFYFGLNSVIICEDSDEELQKLKYLNLINWQKIINEKYKGLVHLSEYNFCEYTDHNKIFINTFYLLDTEKIQRIDTFIKANSDKKADVICPDNIVKNLGREIPLANFNLIDIENYIEKDLKIYDEKNDFSYVDYNYNNTELNNSS